MAAKDYSKIKKLKDFTTAWQQYKKNGNLEKISMDRKRHMKSLEKRVTECQNHVVRFHDLKDEVFASKKHFNDAVTDLERKKIRPIKNYVIDYYRSLKKMKQEKEEKQKGRVSLEDLEKNSKSIATSGLKGLFGSKKKMSYADRKKLIQEGLKAIEKIYAPGKDNKETLVGYIMWSLAKKREKVEE